MMMKRLLLILTLCLPAIMPPAAKAQENEPAWWTEIRAHSALPLAKMEKVLSRAYEVILKKSLTLTTAEALGTAGVKSLSDIDGGIGVYPDGARVMLIANGRILKSWTKPAPEDYRNWARVTLAAYAVALPYSKKAAQADDEEILNICINAALALTDKYSHYNSPEKTPQKKLEKPASIGIRYRRAGKALEVTDVLPDSPAAASVLASGDRILRIDARDTANMSANEILNMLRGEENSPVTLVIRKDGHTETLTLKRAAMPAGTASSDFDAAARVLTVKIPSFSPQTVSSLSRALNEAKEKNAAGIIVDLRANMGGLLREAVLCADLFLPEHTPMLETKGRAPQAFQAFEATTKNPLPDIPVVILIDAKTASSAEFFAAILQESKRAALVGTSTYGKAKIQTAETLDNKGEIYLSWAQYYLPSGYTPDSFGLYPNICTADKNKQEFAVNESGIIALGKWKTADKSEKMHLRDLCPAQNRASETRDIDIAKELIANKALYLNAINDFSLDTAEK